MLFVDDDELARLLADVADPAGDLAEAIRSVKSTNPGTNYFAKVSTACRLWKLGDQAQPPPVLPVLAISVLAATRMHSDGHVLSTNYYLRLAEALVPGGTPTQLGELRNDLSAQSFIDVVYMWSALHDWIVAQNGRVGVSTIRTDEQRLTRIGYPLSQALLKRRDRAELTRFFRAMRMKTSGVPNEDAILRGLDVWTTAGRNQLSDTFMDALRSDEMRPLLGSLVRAFAEAWDGLVITSDGRRRLAIKLGLDPEQMTARWLFPLQDGAGESVKLSGPSGTDQTVILSHRPPSRYYASDGAPPVTPELVLQGFRLRGEAFTAEFPRSPVLIFVSDPQTGAWSTSAGITPFEPHLIAAVSSESASVERLIQRAAAPGWVVRNQGRNAILPGFKLFVDVRFTDPHLLAGALRDDPLLRSHGVAPALTPRARFVRGLPLSRELVQNTYMVGGEPDLLLPTAEEPRIVLLSLNGIEEVVTASGFPFEVRRFPQPEGVVEVVADGQSLSFTLLSESPVAGAPVGAYSFGWSRESTLEAATSETQIVGAVVTTSPSCGAHLVRRGRETWVLHDGGVTKRCSEPGPPSFLNGTGFDYIPTHFEVTVNDSARWVAQRTGGKWLLTELRPNGSREVSADFDVLRTWASTADGANGPAFWELQIGLIDG
ncbi:MULTISPECIES: hypothetical protein [Microbacterium]|uniref:hypothetical protein n=1 Tax=Microbacterium TaxID=33882 RepID=UPI00344EA793